jgi:hypothetical protein
MAICIYDEYWNQEREAAHAAYIADPRFPEIEAEALRRGYRHATLSDINGSAYGAWFAPELYRWRGGLWVRSDFSS